MSNEHTDTDNPVIQSAERDKTVIRTSIIGIITNVVLAAFKATVGLLSNSIAIILDAVNNLSDALSSIITIAGMKLAGKKPDRKHPLGHGRAEYLSAMIVAAIILYAGITSLVESIKKIINPETPDYSTAALIIVSVAVIVKLLLGRYVKDQGKKANSPALTASGSDALFDAVISLSVLISAVIYLISGVLLEAYVGIIISVFIIKAGIEIMTDTVNDILGRRADPLVTGKIKQLICEEPEIKGAYDLIINNYGPDKDYASVHIEVPDVMTVDELDVLTRKLQAKVYMQTKVILTAVGVYSYNTTNDKAANMRNTIQQTVMSHDWVLQLHGFYLDDVNKTIQFDVVLSFDINAHDGVKQLYDEVKAIFPEYELYITSDIDITDL